MARQRSGILRRPTGVTPERRLVTLARDCTTGQTPFDIIHVTTVGWGRRIIEEGQLSTRRCDVFRRNLVYAFLGRPAYKLKEGEDKSAQISRFPFVFIISPDALEPPFHVYPFDTGAGVDGLYSPLADPTVFLEDYELSPELKAAQAHIAWAFGNNRAYFEGEVRSELRDTLPQWELAAISFAQIAGMATTGSNQPDKRASAVEVAYSQHVSTKENVRLVIIPHQFIESGDVRNEQFLKRMNDCNIEWKTYVWRPNEQPNYYIDKISEITCRYFDERGCF